MFLGNAQPPSTETKSEQASKKQEESSKQGNEREDVKHSACLLHLLSNPEYKDSTFL
jgi:hypothetical protein